VAKLVPSQITPEIEALLSRAVRRRYKPKDFILRAGEVPNSLYLITEGSVTVYMEDDDGNELILAYLGPGSYFGELGLFDTCQGRSAWVRVRNNECEVASISYDAFHQLSKEMPSVWLELSGQIAERLLDTNRKLGQLAFLDVTGRIARALLDLSSDTEAMTHPDGMMVKISREELGKLVNCSREMAGKVLKNLETQGLIQIEGRSIIIIDTAK